MTEPKFDPGRVVATRGLIDALGGQDLDAILFPLLQRHLTGDWGDLDQHDIEENELSLREGFRLVSSYTIQIRGEDRKIWVITEADRSVTTFLFPDEY